MTVARTHRGVVVEGRGKSLDISEVEVPALLKCHSKQYPDPPISQGRRLARLGFPQAEAVRYIRDVYGWGGGERNLDRVLANGSERISEALRVAHKAMLEGRTWQAVQTVCNLSQVDVSFGSKLCSFMGDAVIMDARIDEALGYDRKRDYELFLSDCRSLAHAFRMPRASIAETVIFSSAQVKAGRWSCS